MSVCNHGRTRSTLPDLQIQAYIDDRTLAAPTLETLLFSWERSKEWDRDNKWQVNMKKTHVLMIGDRASRQWEESGDDRLSRVEHCVLLGQDVLTNQRILPKKQRERVQVAMVACHKLQRLKLSPELNQFTLSAAVLPKMAYGLQNGILPQNLLKQLRGAIKGALGYAHRIHSWDALCIVANPGHRLDPEAYQQYCHLSAVVAGLQKHPQNKERWQALYMLDRAGPNGRGGPIQTTKRILDALEVTQDHGGLIWTQDDQSVHLIETERPKILHFLRSAIRKRMAQKAVAARPHLEGLLETNLEETRKLIKKRGYKYRTELIAVLTDGIWTNRKKHLCGYRPDQKCAFCGSDVENVPHILYDCPRWQEHWGELGRLKEEIKTLPRCAVWCGHRMKGLPEHLAQNWTKIQKIMATIVHERLNAKDSDEKSTRREKPTMREADAGERQEQPSKRSDPWNFHYTERLHRGERPWAFSRRAWHSFQSWAAHIRVVKEPGEQPPTTLIEALLSYIGFSQGHRFESEVGTEGNGAWVSVQLDRFRSAWLSFQLLTRAEPLLSPKPGTQDLKGWGHRYGLPRLQVLDRTILYPARASVWTALRQLQTWMLSLPKDLRARHDRWRRWTPGLPGSQEREGAHFVHPRLWEIPSRRIRRPETPPPWRSEVRVAFRAMTYLERMCQQGACTPSLKELLVAEGAFDTIGVKAFTVEALL